MAMKLICQVHNLKFLLIKKEISKTSTLKFCQRFSGVLKFTINSVNHK